MQNIIPFLHTRIVSTIHTVLNLTQEICWRNATEDWFPVYGCLAALANDTVLDRKLPFLH